MQITEMLANGIDLTTIPSVGPGIQKLLHELSETGELSYLKELSEQIPEPLREALAIPKLNLRSVDRAFRALKIDSLKDLREKIASGSARERLGGKIAGQIAKALGNRVELLRYQAQQVADAIVDFLRDVSGREVIIAGELRRKAPVISEIVIGVPSTALESNCKRMEASGFVQARIDLSETAGLLKIRQAGFLLNNGLHLSMAQLSEPPNGLELLQITGSADHLQLLKRRIEKGRLRSLRRLRTEREVYQELGLQFIEPELREGHDEIDASAEGRLPSLIQETDIRGDLHSHSIASDGADSIYDMAMAAKSREYEYLAITDHSSRLKLTNGLSEERLLEQIDEIDSVNAQLDGFRVLKSSEVDILSDGSLDYPDEILRRLDLVIGSIHSRFNLSRQEQTARIIHAMNNPYFTILGHATGRLLISREPYDVDMKAILKTAKAKGCFLELNSDPHRLDIGADYCRLARQLGVLISISTDAHSTRELNNIQYGLDEGRRGWLEPASILNTLPLRELLKRIHRRRVMAG
jgi:DNA polymerase (family 10)